MPTERRIKTLKLRQKSLVASLTLIKTFVDDFDEDSQADEVPVRLESLTQLWSDYNRNQNELDTLDEAAIDAHLAERTLLESSYYKVKGFLLAHNKSPLNQTLQSPNHSTLHFPPSASQVRLPDVKLPIFNGKLENWMNFHDLYLSLVHSSTDLSNIQKFYYLRSSLSESALQLIQTIPISAINYPVAWNLLLEHFQNPARLKQNYVDAIFEFQSLRKESASELHSLVEKFEANVKVLKQLGERIEHWDLLLIRLLSTRLDPTTRRDWEDFATTKPAVTFKDLTGFIQRRVTVLQSLQPKIIDAQSPILPKKPAQRSVSSHGANQLHPRKCAICSDHHPLYLCESFSKLSLEEKQAEVRRLQLCHNCLRTGHLSKDCSSSFNCRKCRGRHHTQLCSSDSPTSSESPSSPSHSSNSTEPPSTSASPLISASATFSETISCAAAGTTQKTVLLATALIDIIDDEGNKHTARALLDSGSECCFVSEQFAQRIKARRRKINLPISGIGQSAAHAKTKFVSRIMSRVNEYSTNLEFIVLPKVTVDLPATSIDTSYWDMPPGIKLADPTFDTTTPVDVVIGAEVFFEIFRVPGRIPLGNNLPELVNSVLGWVVCGKSNVERSTPIVANFAIIARRTNDHCRNPLPQQSEKDIERNAESPTLPAIVHDVLVNQSGAQQSEQQRSNQPIINRDNRQPGSTLSSNVCATDSKNRTRHPEIIVSTSCRNSAIDADASHRHLIHRTPSIEQEVSLLQSTQNRIDQNHDTRSSIGARVDTDHQYQHRLCLLSHSSSQAHNCFRQNFTTMNQKRHHQLAPNRHHLQKQLKYPSYASKESQRNNSKFQYEDLRKKASHNVNSSSHD
nr:uncharacterized protein LOC115263335 [Aedes albopictus]